MEKRHDSVLFLERTALFRSSCKIIYLSFFILGILWAADGKGTSLSSSNCSIIIIYQARYGTKNPYALSVSVVTGNTLLHKTWHRFVHLLDPVHTIRVSGNIIKLLQWYTSIYILVQIQADTLLH